ncbi:hypothetical protein [Nocardia brasiliensis]|uniref:hypothetical protein n=1 Tax=Nocardia brasiliensis TaxID=37326 RepID=UPI0036721F67
MIGELARLDGHDDDQARPSAWLQHDDGSWWAVDEYGIAWPVATFSTLDELEDDAEAALAAIGQHVVIDVEPLAVIDTEPSQ